MSARKKQQTTVEKSTAAETATPRWLIYTSVAAILIVYVVLRLPGIGVPLDRDEGAFGHMGQLINWGELPYRDGLDHKPPVAFYINALALHFVPPTARGIHVFLLFYNFLTLLFLFFLARIYFRSLSAGLWCAFSYAVFSASPAIQGFTASTEMWALLPIAASLLLAVLGVRKNSLALIFWSGVAGAVACWTKQTVFTSILFVVLFVGFASRTRDRSDTASLLRPSRWMREVGVWLGGAVLFSISLLIYFAARGVFHEFIYWSFLYGFSYLDQASISKTAEALQETIIEIGQGDFILLSVGLVVAIWSLIKRQRWAYFVLAFFVLSFFGTLPGFAYRHYFAQLALPVALAAGQAFSILLGQVRGAFVRAGVTLFCGLIALIVPINVNRQYFLERDTNAISRYYFGLNPFPESKAVAAFIAGNTEPKDRVLIVGSEPQILFYAQRRSPSAFLMMYPLMTTHARYKEFQHQMLAEVERNPPTYIVAIVSIPFSVMWDHAADPEIMRSLEGVINQNYTLDRLRLVSGLEGEWINAEDSRVGPETPLMYLFKRRPSP